VHQIALLHAPYSPALSPWGFFNPTTKTSVERPSPCWRSGYLITRPWQNISAPFQKVLSRTASKTTRNAGSIVLM
jgi:hypothetical protein